ncbi:AtzH-like domain-containing protein [Agromyces sp. SYSU T00194]|uniref:AtzH-like domain-containing protein n=1 Tax=Agromyces chitinivorans TaxID=3158560 RepID=UPI0033936E42
MADAGGPRVRVAGGADAPEGLLGAVLGYEAALMADDLDALADWFEPGDDTMRADASGLLVGHDAITRFRGRRGGAGARRVVAVHVLPVADGVAHVVVAHAPGAGGRGTVSQLWRRGQGRWRIAAAHVTAPAPAFDRRTWRTLGDPLLPPTASGALDGRTVAVKDVFAVAGHPIGAGIPAYLDEAPVEPRSAAAVDALRAAGAAIRGIARTDQFAYSIAGRNPAYGTPPNPAVPGAVSGGSTSGPASAVALGQADLGLGTDTAGSIRVPASYQGLWGLRTTHGAVDRAGVLPLAPRFDTVGWLARDRATLEAAARASLPRAAGADAAGGARPLDDAVLRVAPALLEGLGPGVREAFEAAVRALGASGCEVRGLDVPALGAAALDALFAAFRTAQAAEAWRAHGTWITAHPDALAPDVAARFAWASEVTADDEAAAIAVLDAARRDIDAALGDGLLLLPSAASVAPALDAEGADIEAVRTATLRMTAVAGATGRPALSVPGAEVDGAPLGTCVVGPRGGDLALVSAAARWHEAIMQRD